MTAQQIKHLIRIADNDIAGEKNLLYGLTKIRGVKVQLANALCKISGLDPVRKIGGLSEAEIKQITTILDNPIKSGIPVWMVNRRRDPETGEHRHLLGTKLLIAKDDDIKRLKKIKAYRGVRHMFGLPSRGQRTRSNFRKNKGKSGLGVKTSGKTRGGT